MAYTRNSGIIPRKSLTARTRVQVVDSASAFSNKVKGTTFTEFTLERCTYYPATGADLSTLEFGERSKEVYTVITATAAKPAVQGTNSLADQVKLPSVLTGEDSWFTVVNVKRYSGGVIPCYQLLVVRQETA